MSLVRFALAQLRGGWRRTLAALLAVFTAVTSFVLLTGSAQTQRLEVTRTVDENFRGAYDILVRPTGSATALEASDDQVRSSFLSGTYGGISLDQVARIKALGGTEAVAPIAMLGVTMQYLETQSTFAICCRRVRNGACLSTTRPDAPAPAMSTAPGTGGWST